MTVWFLCAFNTNLCIFWLWVWSLLVLRLFRHLLLCTQSKLQRWKLRDMKMWHKIAGMWNVKKTTMESQNNSLNCWKCFWQTVSSKLITLHFCGGDFPCMMHFHVLHFQCSHFFTVQSKNHVWLSWPHEIHVDQRLNVQEKFWEFPVVIFGDVFLLSLPELMPTK